MATKEELYAEAYRRGILPADKKAMYEEAVRRGLMQNPELKAKLESIDLPDLSSPKDTSKSQQQTIEGEVGTGLKESARALISAAASVADIVPEIGDSIQSAAAWSAGKLGVGDGTYTPAARITNYLPDWAKPQTTAGKTVAEIIPFFAAPEGDAATVAERATTVGQKMIQRVAQSFKENAVGSLAGASQGDANGAPLALLENMALGETFHQAGRLLGAGYRAIKGNPDAAMKELVDLAKEYNVPLMATDVASPKTAIGRIFRTYGEQVPIVGTGGARAAQQEERRGVLGRLKDQFPEPTDDEIYQSLVRRKDKIQSAAGRRYKDIENRMGQDVIPTAETIKAIDSVLDELNRPGKMRDKASISALEEFKNDFMAAPQTYDLLKENRTSFRDDIRGERQIMPKNMDRLNMKIESAMTKDLHDAVQSKLGPEGLAKYKQANSVYAGEREKIKNTRLKNVFEKGEMIPEKATESLFSKHPSEVKAIYRSLDSKGKDAFRREIISRALSKATDEIDGREVVNPTRFIREMGKMDKQFQIAFRGDDAKQLIGIQKLLRATRHAQDAALNPPTGARAVPLLMAVLGGSLAGFVPAISVAIGGGGLARAAESKVVRDALIRLAGTPEGTTAFEGVIKNIANLISNIAKGGMAQ